VWDLRWRWDEIRPQLQARLRASEYRPGPVRRFHEGGETIEVWSALDALVLKATALVLTAHWLPDFSPHCHHLESRGGAKAAVRFVHEQLAANTFVFLTDAKSDYASIVTVYRRSHPGTALDIMRSGAGARDPGMVSPRAYNETDH
jgi:hypothetical protein